MPTSNTTEMTKLAAVINDNYRTIGMMADWPWLYDRQTLTTADDITTGTVSVTNNSTAITFSSVPTPSVAGRVIHVPGNAVEGAVFRISTHTAGAAPATLEKVYTGATNTAAGYSVWQDRYDLASDVGDVLWIRRYGYTQPLRIVSPMELDQIKAYDVGEGPPQLCAIYGFDTEGDPTTVKQLHVHPYSDDLYTLEINFRQTLNTELSGSTRAFIPDDVVQVLEYGALADGYAVFLNDTERASYYQQKFNDLLRVMIARHRKHQGDPQMQPKDYYRTFYRRGKRISPATVDLGNTFDRWPSEF